MKRSIKYYLFKIRMLSAINHDKLSKQVDPRHAGQRSPYLTVGTGKLVQGAGPEIELAGTAGDCGEATRIIYETPINVIVVDLDGDIGIDAIAELCSISPARVLALTVSRDVSVHDGAILAGARGIVTRSEPVASLLKAIEKIDEGEFWIDGAATGRIFFHLAQRRKVEYETPDHSGLPA